MGTATVEVLANNAFDTHREPALLLDVEDSVPELQIACIRYLKHLARYERLGNTYIATIGVTHIRGLTTDGGENILDIGLRLEYVSKAGVASRILEMLLPPRSMSECAGMR